MRRWTLDAGYHRTMVRLRRLCTNPALLAASITATILLLYVITPTYPELNLITSGFPSIDIDAIDAANPDGTGTRANHTDSLRRRSNCQIIYVLGVEGSLHHGFMPIIKVLADQQVDIVTSSHFHVVKGHEVLRAAIFGSKQFAKLPISDPQLVQDTVDAMCPPGDERQHIILEGNSFPSGGSEDDTFIRPTTFRVRRQSNWKTMTPNEIASSPQALNHPTNLYEFYNAFSPYADVRFVVLHRPYLDTIASHTGFDSGPIPHSTVISGFLLLLSRFLVSHMYNNNNNNYDASASGYTEYDNGKQNGGVPLWTIVCVEQLSSKEFETQQQLLEARESIVRHLATFLGWPIRSCPQCFDNWRESSKSSPESRLGEATTNILLDHVNALEGIWPPRRIEDGLPQQQCRT